MIMSYLYRQFEGVIHTKRSRDQRRESNKDALEWMRMKAKLLPHSQNKPQLYEIARSLFFYRDRAN